jgi:hypothetical protein
MNRLACLAWISAIIAALCLLYEAPAASQFQENDVKKTLEVRVTFNANWNIDTEGENNNGSLNLNMKGILEYNQEMSSLPKGMMTIMLPYKIRNMQAYYSYKQRITDKDPQKCSSLIADYSDSGTMQVEAVPGPGDLMVHQAGSIGRLTKMNQFAPPEAQKFLHDYYDFFLVGPDQEIKGRRRSYQDCKKMVDHIKSVKPCDIKIRFLMKEDGAMTGGANWTTEIESGDPILSVKTSNLPKEMEPKSFSPENEPGNVRYSLSWEIKEAVALTIQRKVREDWIDIDSDESLKDITVGERIELRGVVFPEGKKMNSPKWSIDGNNYQNIIKKYDASNAQARVIPITDADLNKEEIVFFWYRGKQGIVKLQADVDGYGYEKEVQFQIKKPDYSVEWENSRDSRIDDFIEGGDIVDKWPQENWPPHPPQYDQFQGQELRGLRYDGILFTCTLKSDTPGETQWVQLIQDVQKISTFDENFASSPGEKRLDKVYPCARNNSFFDAPGIPINTANEKGYQSWRIINDFDLYIMFRPKGKTKAETEKNEWIPVKLIKWSWGGEMRRNNPDSGWYINSSTDSPRLGGGTLEPYGEDEPTVENTEEYPTWSGVHKQ